MATDTKKIINNLLEFYDFNNRTIIKFGAGGGQLIEFGRMNGRIRDNETIPLRVTP